MYLKAKQLRSVDFRTAWGKLGPFGMRIVRVLFARFQKLCYLSDGGTPMRGSLPSGLDAPAIRIGRDCTLVFPTTRSIVLGNCYHRQFCSSCCKIGRCYLDDGEEMQDAEHKHRARPSGYSQIREDAESEGNLLWLN